MGTGSLFGPEILLVRVSPDFSGVDTLGVYGRIVPQHIEVGGAGRFGRRLAWRSHRTVRAAASPSEFVIRINWIGAERRTETTRSNLEQAPRFPRSDSGRLARLGNRRTALHYRRHFPQHRWNGPGPLPWPPHRSGVLLTSLLATGRRAPGRPAFSRAQPLSPTQLRCIHRLTLVVCGTLAPELQDRVHSTSLTRRARPQSMPEHGDG